MAESMEMLLGDLSQKLLDERQSARWNRLFLQGGLAQVRLQQRRGYLLQLVATAPEGVEETEAFRAEMQRVLALAGGQVDPCVRSGLLASFQHLKPCLGVAVALQRYGRDLGLRVAVAGGTCAFATFECVQAPWWTVVGTQAVRVGELLAATPSGTILVGAEVYDQAERDMPDALASCLVSQEYLGEHLAQVSISVPPPRGSAQLSTFAGLGLTS